MRYVELFANKYADVDSSEAKRLVSAIESADLSQHANNRRSDSTLYQKYKKDLPIILETGYKGHSVSVIFYKDYLIIANRGENSHSYYPSVIYTIDSRMVSAQIIKKFQDLDLQSSKEWLAYVDELSHLLDAKVNSMRRYGEGNLSTR